MSVNIILRMDDNGSGHFHLMDGQEELGKMQVERAGSNLTVNHTEVHDKAEGKGYGKMLLNEMVHYARKNNLKVTAYCPFVQAQFKRHPDEYADVWNKT